ncbi:MAG: family 10 glycosylhydrolase [Pirellulales bacterium]|nr:family 10 glycosylhydrolase [Pirellulales bacterium]
MMTVPSIVLFLTLTGIGNESILDSFEYADSTAAQQAWTASGGTPPVVAVPEADRPVLECHGPFATQPETERTILDCDQRVDLAAFGYFSLEIWAEHPEAIGYVTLFFRSGSGWYACSSPLTDAGWQTLRFSKPAYRIEGKPEGWNAIDGIRLSCWKGKPIDTRIRFRRLSAGWNDVGLVVPAADRDRNESEIRTAREVAGRVGRMLDELGIPFDQIDEQTVAKDGLGKRCIALLAYNPTLGNGTIDGLVRFVERGGKLFVCYNLPAQLGTALGFDDGVYFRPTAPMTLSEIEFEPDATPGLPPSVRQASWNIRTATPVRFNARVLGWWLDNRGERTGHAAMLLSDRGAYFSHIVLEDDWETKKQLLASVLGALAPPLWQQMADNASRRLNSIGHCHQIEDLAQFVRDQQMEPAIAKLKEATLILSDTQAMRSRGDFRQSIDGIRQARTLLTDAYLLSEPSVPREGRAWWNHSGTGADDGDWERTAARLAKHGFNMIFPNMLWGGRAHYPSQVLPESETYQKYGDQIARCVTAAHRHNLEVHVWKVNYNLSGAPRSFVDRMRQAGRTQVTCEGTPHDWLCPSHPENIQLELESMLEVARHYEVDGLHFDYIRYPDRSCCYCDGCRERFEAAIHQKVAQWPADCYSGPLQHRYQDWRCEQITQLVAAVHDQAKKIRPEIKISAAVFSNYPACRQSIGQDWAAWIESGYLDFICPMDYTNHDAAFIELVKNQVHLVGGRIPIYPGIGATASRSTLPAEQVVGQIHYARALGANGFTIFNLSTNSANEILPGIALGATSKPANPPHKD